MSSVIRVGFTPGVFRSTGDSRCLVRGSRSAGRVRGGCAGYFLSVGTPVGVGARTGPFRAESVTSGVRRGSDLTGCVGFTPRGAGSPLVDEGVTGTGRSEPHCSAARSGSPEPLTGATRRRARRVPSDEAPRSGAPRAFPFCCHSGQRLRDSCVLPWSGWWVSRVLIPQGRRRRP